MGHIVVHTTAVAVCPGLALAGDPVFVACGLIRALCLKHAKRNISNVTLSGVNSMSLWLWSEKGIPPPTHVYLRCVLPGYREDPRRLIQRLQRDRA